LTILLIVWHFYSIDDENITYTENWDRLWHEEWQKNQPRLITHSNKIYIVNEKQILPVTLQPVAFNDTNAVNEISYASLQEPTKFIKVHYYVSKLFLCYFDK
jgi:hypothetical protein